MSKESTFKQILHYIDGLHEDLGRLVVLVEQMMEEKGYMLLPAAGNSIGWYLSSHYAMPQRWRLTNLSRFYVPEGEELFDHSLAYFVNVASDTRFPFPTILCAQVFHPPLPADVIYNKVWNTNQLLAFGQQQQKDWRLQREEQGWFVVEPVTKTPIQYLRGYLLNVFDLADRQHVIDNIILPLTEPEADLDELLTIEKYCPVVSEESIT